MADAFPSFRGLQSVNVSQEKNRKAVEVWPSQKECHFTVTWGPAAAGVALDELDEYVAACEGFVTEGKAWLETLTLDRTEPPCDADGDLLGYLDTYWPAEE